MVTCDICGDRMRARGYKGHLDLKHKKKVIITQVSKPVTRVTEPVTRVGKIATRVTETTLVTTEKYYHADCCICKKQITEKNGLRVWSQVELVKYPEPGNKFHKKWVKNHEYMCRSCSKSEMVKHTMSGGPFDRPRVWEARELEPDDHYIPVFKSDRRNNP